MIAIIIILLLLCLLGITVHTPDGEHRCRGMILTCTVDLLARAAVCNMKGFNGSYSCATCLDSGDNTIGESRMHRYWPFNLSCEIRNVHGVQSAFVKASQTGEAVSIKTVVVL